MVKLLKKLLAFTLKQYDVGMLPGAVNDLWQRTTGYLSLINTCIILPTGYYVLEDKIHQYMPGMTFWLLLSVGLIFSVLALTVVYKILLPSSIKYGNYMRYKHHELLARDIGLLKAQLDRIEKKLSGVDFGIVQDSVGKEVNDGKG